MGEKSFGLKMDLPTTHKKRSSKIFGGKALFSVLIKLRVLTTLFNLNCYGIPEMKRDGVGEGLQ